MKKIEENKLLISGQISLSNFCVLDVVGDSEKALDFLQGQVTSDLSVLQNNHYQLSAICNQKGQVIADIIVKKVSNEFKIIVDKTLKDIFIQDLEPYAKFFRVSFKETAEVVHGFVGEAKSIRPLIDNHGLFISIDIDDKALIDSISHDEWLASNIMVGNYLLTQKESGQFRPSEINYDKKRVSFNKGCFRGQEIIARMKYLGKETPTFHVLFSDKEINFSNLKKIKVLLGLKVNNTYMKACIAKQDIIDELID